MSESYIQNPAEGAGKKVRAVAKSIGGQTVYSEFQVADNKLNFVGSYVFCLRIAATTSAGFQFLHIYNPTGSGKILKVKSILICSDIGSVANQIKVTRTTSLGTGTTQTATKKDSTFAASASNVRSTMTVNAALDQDVLGIAKPTTATLCLLNINYKDSSLEDDQIVLREIEGIVVQQLVAGAVTEYLTITIEWEEYTTT